MPFWIKDPVEFFDWSMALRAVDFEVWKGAARAWLTTHPTFDHRAATRAERQGCWELRAAYAVVTAAAHREGRSLGALPCDCCGEWTHSWCECCEAPPAAVCTSCDAEEKICHACAAQNRSWREARQAYAASTPEEVVEVTGFTDEDGSFRRLSTPFRVPLREVLTPEGQPDAAEIARRAAAHGQRSHQGHGTGTSRRHC